MALRKLRDLAERAGRWLGLTGPAPACTTAVPGDRFDDMTWQETRDQARALQDLIAELAERHDYAADLIRDMFLAAYKVDPQVRAPAEMHPSRRVNRQIIASMLDAPEFTELRRETAGDQYAAAMAVIAQADQLRRLTEHAREAQDKADAGAEAQQAASQAQDAVRKAMADAEAQAGDDGDVPDGAAEALEQAIAQAGQAGQAASQAGDDADAALGAAAAGLRAAARQGAAQAGDQAREEAALMDAWGVGHGELQKMDFEQRRRLAERLRSGKLRDFASLIGRFRRMAHGERARRVEGAPGELTGVTLSGDVSRLIPSEMAVLGVPALRAVFAARLAENRLLTYQTRGIDRSGQGAIVVVADSSSSMAGKHAGGITREAWSKALILSLLDQARAARRDLAVIYFGGRDPGTGECELQTFRFPAGRAAPVADVIEMAEFFFAGGTDFEAPLGLAADLVVSDFTGDGKEGADITFVTDGLCDVSQEFMAAWQAGKAQAGFRVWGISLGSRPSPVMTALCDNVREVTDLAEPGEIADMFRVI
jgi:uncharacterized protein with von Willebrand factor type A (vWA) domain